MSNLFKIILFASPVVALVFYYVVSQQSKLDTEIKKDDVVFEEKWDEFQAEQASDPIEKKKYQERAEIARKKIEELEAKEKVKEKKAEKFEEEFEKAIEEVGKEKK